MSTKFLIPLCAAAALLAACDKHDDSAKMGNDTASGETAPTPGTTATPADTPPPPAETPPSETPPSETPPPSEPPKSGG